MVPRVNAVSKSAKNQISLKCPGGGGGRVNDQLPTFDAESKSAKNQISLCLVGGWVEGGGGGVGGSSNQLSTFDAKSKSAKTKFPYESVCVGLGGGGEEGVATNFQLLMLSPNQLKSYIPYVEGFF